MTPAKIRIAALRFNRDFWLAGFQPEIAVESQAQLLRFAFKPRRPFVIARAAEERGDLALRPVRVALDFDEGDWGTRQTAVRVDDRVAGILPDLVDRPMLRRAGVFDVAVSVKVASFRHDSGGICATRSTTPGAGTIA